MIRNGGEGTNRNGFLFEGKLFDAREVVRKAKDEADSWFLAQQVQTRMELTERVEVREPTVSEAGVLEGWVLCEIGMDWSKTGDIMGAAWITKNCWSIADGLFLGLRPLVKQSYK